MVDSTSLERAASAHHDRVVGGLDSAVRGLYTSPERFQMHAEQRRMLERWGSVDEFDVAAAEKLVAASVE
jgi:hypothetical protein